MIRRFLFAAIFCLTGVARSAEFMAGADISALAVHEQHGAVYGDGGVAGDAIHILRDHGANWFRLRLFVDPTNDDNPATPQHDDDPFVVNDLAYTIALAQRAKAAGAKVLLDFHYSDTWADPGKQYKPAAWTGLSFNALTIRVHDYTRDAVAAFKAAGALPEMVQIGNEISSGMLWDDGKLWRSNVPDSTEFNNLATLLAAGMSGAKAGAGAGSEPITMIHTDKGSNWAATSGYLNMLLPRLQTRGADPDVIGFSYYPKWHYNPANGSGDVAAVQTTLNNTATVFAKPVVLVEAGFASRGQQSEPAYEFPVSAAGQREFLDAMVNAVQNVPDDMGWGAFWWYAEARPTPGLNVWEGGRYGLFDQNGNLLPAIDAFAAVNPRPPAGDYNRDGVVDGGDLAAWQSAFGQTGAGLAADGDNDGDVDGADLLFWQHGLLAVANGAMRNAVPEPASLPLVALTTLPFASRIVRRHRR